jgi:phage tail-like protein
MPGSSSYLRYLPALLSDPTEEPSLLGEFLCVFEKVLTGIDDGTPIELPLRADRPSSTSRLEHEPLARTIDRLHELFDPWRTRPELLPWLATWVALEFPTDPLGERDRRFLWDEYQQRKITAEMARIYRLRGLKDGLLRFFELYTVTAARPRIALDDGNRVVVLDPGLGRAGRVRPVVAHNPTVYRARHPQTGRLVLVLGRDAPVHPSCIALAPDGALLLGDTGTVQGWSVFTPQFPATPTATVAPGVWRYGRLANAGSTRPERIAVRDAAGTTIRLKRPVAIAVDRGPPANVYILDLDEGPSTDNGLLYRVDPAQWGVAGLLGRVPGSRWPVGMVLDSDRSLVIVDRGGSVSLQEPPKPRLLRFTPSGVSASTRPAFPRDLLPSEIEPLSLAMLACGDLLLGDAGRQTEDAPGDLVRVRLQNGAWRVQRRFANTDGLLAAPVGIVEHPGRGVYVADLGLKPYDPRLDPGDPEHPRKPFLAHRTDAPAVYRVDLGQEATPASSVSEPGQLVHPTGLLLERGLLYVSDAGEGATTEVGSVFTREWRAEPHQFGVVVHFPLEPITSVATRRQMLRTISSIVAREKPAHADWSYAFSYIEEE